MLNLVIVEDEEIIRRGLVCTIDWLKMGAKVVGEAANGKEALEVIKATKPDVILTDIKMRIFPTPRGHYSWMLLTTCLNPLMRRI